MTLLEHIPAGVILTTGPQHLASPEPDYRNAIAAEWNHRMAAIESGHSIEIEPMEINVTAKNGTVWFIRIHATSTKPKTSLN